MSSEKESPLSDLLWGIERETHRVTPEGGISMRSHPDSLRPPRFTRDFAESQLEIVTAPRPSIDSAVEELERLTREAAGSIGDELLWPFSMPPALPAGSSIPVARLSGGGETGRRAELYRRGLALRYGAARQMICGVHVNVSAGKSLISRLMEESPLLSGEAGGPGKVWDGYALRLTRSLYADLALLVLFFGVSPVMGGAAATEPSAAAAPGPSAASGLPPAATAVSYRNSPFGYAGREFRPYLDLGSLPAYTAGIRRGLKIQSAQFASLGLVRGGQVIQLNDRVFQTDKEFYAPIRLKQAPLPGETTTQALMRRGVGWVELRVADVDPFHAAGVSRVALRLLHLFILDGLFRPSDAPGRAAREESLDAAQKTALLNPLSIRGVEWAAVLERARVRLSGLYTWAERLEAEGAGGYMEALAHHASILAEPSTLAAPRLARLLADGGLSWTGQGVGTASALMRALKGGTREREYAGV